MSHDADEIKKAAEKIVEAAEELMVVVDELTRKALENSVEVVVARKKFLDLLAQTTGQSAHIIIERPKPTFALFPLGTGEPKLMVKAGVKGVFSEKDKEEFKKLGIKIE